MQRLSGFKWWVFFSICLSLLYFFLRLFNLLHLPIFTDEAIYIRWSQIAKQDAAWRFISLTDGKQPMFVWITMLLLRVIKDPLLAGRMTSVLAGFATMVGIFLLTRQLFKNTAVGLLSSLLYVISPFALVYNRMALYESLVGMFAVWSLYIEVLLVQKLRFDIAFLAGLIIGGGALTKSNAFFNIYFLPATLLLFDYKKSFVLQRLLKWVGLAALVTVLVYLYYSILRLSPLFGVII
jgi:4-amino-4-deoxy-L-arabinose transferase-like glycosyltransferase